MPFEQPSPERKNESATRRKHGMNALVWMGALLAVGAAAERAEADDRKGKKTEASEPFRYEGTMREMPTPEGFGFESVKTAELPGGERVTVSEMVNMEPEEGVKEERLLDILVMADPDPKVDGDERWVGCQITHATFESDQPDGGPQALTYFCSSSAADARASGLHMASPLGDFQVFAPGDKEYEKMGAFPKTDDDLVLYELNALHWAYQGLKATGYDKDPRGAYLTKELRAKIGVAQSREYRRPLNEKAIDALKKEWKKESGE